MRRDTAVLCMSVLWGAATVAALSLTANPYLRLILAVPLVFFLPGAAMLHAIRFRMASPEHYALAIGLSMALTVLGGMCLNGVGLLTPFGWILWLCAFTFLCEAIAAWRGSSTVMHWRRPSLAIRHYLMAASALGLVTMTVLVTNHHYKSYLPFPYTDFWMVPDGADQGGLFIIGIKNGERRPQEFDVKVMVDGETVAVWQDIHLSPDQTLNRAVLLPSGRKAEAWLLHSGDPTEVYRQVSAWLGDARRS